MNDTVVENKIKHILIEISKANGSETDLIELLEHSSFDFQEHYNIQSYPGLYNLQVTTLPDIFTKNYNSIQTLERTIKARINKSTKLTIDKLLILPDYNKLQIIDSKIFAIVTEWEEINQLQHKLLESLTRSKTSIDFQGIGLISRTLMDKLARQVFNPEKHKPQDDKIKIANGNSKNQLHSYIDSILSGADNTRFRKLANSAIDFVEDSIDLMNETTHSLEAEKHLAEVCVVSTISAISIIKLIRQLE